MTAGTDLTATLRRYFSIGTSTRRYRKGRDMHAAMIESLTLAGTCPGYFAERTEGALRTGFGVALAYSKHVSGYRIDGTLAQRINAMTAWQFAALLGQMVDAGVENAGTGEYFFSQMAREAA